MPLAREFRGPSAAALSRWPSMRRLPAKAGRWSWCCGSPWPLARSHVSERLDGALFAFRGNHRSPGRSRCDADSFVGAARAIEAVRTVFIAGCEDRARRPHGRARISALTPAKHAFVSLLMKVDGVHPCDARAQWQRVAAPATQPHSTLSKPAAAAPPARHLERAIPRRGVAVAIAPGSGSSGPAPPAIAGPPRRPAC